MSENEFATQKKTNLLIYEKSPYLLQHSHNPVDWYPWSKEAFDRAITEDKPIFLSIGYATCHWCHVMAHETFEDEEVSTYLNQDFISIKVDREERPDVDAIYMSACQAITGQGGWPLSVFMTPKGKPFFAGTYFPRTSRMGMPGFIDIIIKLAHMWKNDRTEIIHASEQIVNAIQLKMNDVADPNIIGLTALEQGYTQLSNRFDPHWGGFGDKPKFPTPHNLTFLLRYYLRNNQQEALHMVKKSLVAMRNGGIFDQIGFGFHRYSVDERWLVPHFEKMLYDQALLAIAYIEAFQITANNKYALVAGEIFSYVLRDMTSPEGGFYSAEDADSEGKEGLFYVWTPDLIKQQLGNDEGDLFCNYFDITEAGNFEDGFSIPNISLSVDAFSQKTNLNPKELSSAIEKLRRKLFVIREKRIHPLKDDKIIVSWNGLMIAAFAKGYMATGENAYIEAAKKAADFLLNNLKDSQGRLLRRYRKGDVAFAAYLEDYAFLIWGLLELYEASFEIPYLKEALSLNQDMINRFWDGDKGGFFFSGEGNENLISKTKEIYDGAIPSGNSVAALNLMRLGRITGEIDLEKKAERIAAVFANQVKEMPMAQTYLLSAIDFMVGPTCEIVISGDPDDSATQTMINIIRKKFQPNRILVFIPTGRERKRIISLAPFLEQMKPVDNRPTIYLCENYSCKKPVTSIEELEKIMG